MHIKKIKRIKVQTKSAVHRYFPSNCPSEVLNCPAEQQIATLEEQIAPFDPQFAGIG